MVEAAHGGEVLLVFVALKQFLDPFSMESVISLSRSLFVCFLGSVLS
jgi:hypothetical protein